MKIKPVYKYKTPSYPLQEEVRDNPELLKHVPKRWKSRLLCSILYSACIGTILTGCRAAQTQGEAPPPYFMTEDEAYAIIVDEVSSAGIRLEKQGPLMKNIHVPFTEYDSGTNKRIKKDIPLDISVDLFDKTKKVGFEFMSDTDFYPEKVKLANLEQNYDKACEIIQDQINKGNDGNKIGVLYDPEEYTKEQSEKLLRTQVKEFISWLKAQGVV